MTLLKKILIRVGCTFGVHWSGIKGLGMYGDANQCAHCGADRYGLIVIKEVKHD